MTKKRFGLSKRYYIILASRDEDGTLRKLPVPMHYAYAFVAVAVVGAFTVAGLAGSYSRMLIKTARFNQLRLDQDLLRKDYAHLEKQEHERDAQAASLSSLATEVSALYGITASRLATPISRMRSSHAATSAAGAALLAESPSSFTNENYLRSVDIYTSLRRSALSGEAARSLAGSHSLDSFTGLDSASLSPGQTPSLWPVLGPIRSSFGQREDPITGNGEGEFHTGIDISAPIGTPVRAAADGVVKSAEMQNGYGREIVLDHGQNVETCYAHMSGFAVSAGQSVLRGQIIGYVGVSGRTTGAHLHYEVRIRNAPVNPYRYLHQTSIELATAASVPPAAKP